MRRRNGDAVGVRHKASRAETYSAATGADRWRSLSTVLPGNAPRDRRGDPNLVTILCAVDALSLGARNDYRHDSNQYQTLTTLCGVRGWHLDEQVRLRLAVTSICVPTPHPLARGRRRPTPSFRETVAEIDRGRDEVVDLGLGERRVEARPC